MTSAKRTLRSSGSTLAQEKPVTQISFGQIAHSPYKKSWLLCAPRIFAVLLLVTVTGCASTLGGPELTEDERALRQQSQVFDETVLGGAAAGAALGGLACMLMGGDLGSCGSEIVAGAAVGAAGGYLVATQQRAAEEQVRQTDIVTRDIVAVNEQIAKSVVLAKNVLNENRTAASALRERIAKNEAQAEEIKAMQARLRSNVAVMSTTIDKLNERKQTFVDALASLEEEGEDTTAMRVQVREMEDQIAQLVQYRSALEEEIDVELMG